MIEKGLAVMGRRTESTTKTSRPLVVFHLFQRCQEAFVPTNLEFTEPERPENQTRKRYPDLSNRTRQRDFKELSRIGYRIVYNPLHDPGRDWNPHYEPGWYCDFPTGAYDITF